MASVATTPMVAVSTTSSIQQQKTNGNHSEVSKTVTIVDTAVTTTTTSIETATNGDGSDSAIDKSKNGENTPPNENGVEKSNTLKKRVSSSKTPNRTREMTKAKRVRFFRNGDKFWTGILVAVSNERYK